MLCQQPQRPNQSSRGQCLHEGEYNSQNIHNINLANALWVMEQTLRQWLLERSMQQEYNFRPRHQALVHMFHAAHIHASIIG